MNERMGEECGNGREEERLESFKEARDGDGRLMAESPGVVCDEEKRRHGES